MPGRHSDSGLSVTVISAMPVNAGSVAVLAFPIFPNTRSTSGKVVSNWSCTCNTFVASVIDSPGTVVGIYRIVPSFNGGMNSAPRRVKAGIVSPTATRASNTMSQRTRSAPESIGW